MGMKKIKNKKIIMIIILFIGIVSSYAYFTTTNTFENIFRTKKYGTKVEEVFESPDDWKPGDETPKTVTVKNEEDTCVNVRVSFEEEWRSKNNVELPLVDANSHEHVALVNLDHINDWEKKGDYYYYRKDLLKGESTTSFLKSVTYNPKYNGNVVCTTTKVGNQTKEECKSEDMYAGGKYTLTLKIEMIQCKGMEDEWNITQEEIEAKYSITYHLNGGSEGNNTIHGYSENSDTITLVSPKKTGYNFQGWYESDTFEGTPITSIPKGSSGNKAYYAKWEAKTNVIMLNHKEATTSGTTKVTGTYDALLPNITIPKKEYTITYDYDGGVYATRSGNQIVTAIYTFDGYYTKEEGNGEKYINGSGEGIKEWKYISSKTLYAYWIGGSITLPHAVKEGYTLDGWYKGNTKIGIGGEEYTPTKNETLKAKWNLGGYSITYTLDNGNCQNCPTNYTIESEEIILPEPTRNGYTFIGWTGSNGTIPQKNVSIAKGSSGNKSYTANWEITTYTISYTLNGGTASNPGSYTIETETFSLNNPTRSGYTFKGWTGSNGEEMETSVSIHKGSTGNKNYIAHWERNTYTISYTLNGGTASNPGSYTVETETFTLTNPTRSGYTFSGWTGSNGTTPQTNLSIVKGSTGNKNYTANWSRNTYTISYTLNGGTNHSNNPTSYHVETSTITLGDPTKTGYTFTGWTTEGVTTPTKNLTIPIGSTGNKSYTANWQVNTYAVTYNGNGNTGGSTASTTCTYGQTFTPAANGFTKTGYTFNGWSGSTNCTGNMTMTATWKANTYTLTLNPNGGSYNGSTSNGTKTMTYDSSNNNSVGTATRTYTMTYNLGYNSLVNTENFSNANDFKGWYTASSGGTQVYNVSGQNVSGDYWTANYSSGTWKYPNNATLYAQYNGMNVTLKATPSRTGYTFNGWYQGSTKIGNGGATYFATSNQTFDASWTRNIYAISYTLNGGTNHSNNPTSYHVETSTITLGDPTKTGYTFTGWTTEGVTTPTKNLTIPIGSTGNKSYTANWSRNTYTISYTLNGGTNHSNNPTSYHVETSTITLGDPTRTGHTFTGWTTEGVTTPTKNLTIPIGNTGNKSYTANWSANTYTINYLGNGNTGGSTAQSTHTYGIAKALTSNGFTKTGYTFAGWATSTSGEVVYSNGQLVSNLTTTANGTVTLYAKWILTVNNFGYTGGQQSYTVPETGTYKLEVWGAQGGSVPSTITGENAYPGGYGGYSYGNITLTKGTRLYINVGGSGKNPVSGWGESLAGGYNGGGAVNGNSSMDHEVASGGGATHIATASGVLKNLSSNTSSILIVAGGGGGAWWQPSYSAYNDYNPRINFRKEGGSGGGINGMSQSQIAYASWEYSSTGGGTQTSGYAFGEGQSLLGGCGGGSGYYGGYAVLRDTHENRVCAGGSGYIGNSSLSSKRMHCYRCTTSSATNTKTTSTTSAVPSATAKSAKIGDGYARITFVG